MLFDLARFRALLGEHPIGGSLVYRESVDSTMVEARELADAGAAHGTMVLAEEQTAGRGRRGRGFHSPAGENLYFTLVLRLEAAAHRRLPVALPLAVCEGVRGEDVEARIKWPNDIWVGSRKLCGMLIDAEMGADGPLAMPGIGINVNGDPTLIPELRDTATSIRREAGRQIHREALLARICNELARTLDLPATALAERYRTLSLTLGRPVTVTPATEPPFDGLAAEILEDGSLVVLRANGVREVVHAADVSLRPA